jgi:hypothetical protein
MQAAGRPFVLASAAMLATSMVSASPVVSHQLQPLVRSIESRLVDVVSGLEAVPYNLFEDILSIPGNELDAFNQLGVSLMGSGTWWVSSATNLWGEDTGDPGRFMALTQMAIPFPDISGQGSPEPGFGDFSWADAASGQLGLSQQISLFLDAQLPVSASSDATWSAPLAPVSPITGLTGIDRSIWSLQIFTGQTQFPLINNWFQVPLSDLTQPGGYTFPTVVNPSLGVGENGAVPSDDVWGIAGTQPLIDPETGLQVVNDNGFPVNVMPWSNETFQLNLLYPFENFYNSVQDPLDTTTFLSDVNLPSFDGLIYSLQTFLAASVIAFYPFVPGTPFCIPVCEGLPSDLSMPDIVEDINNLYPGNADIQHWLDLYNTPSTGPGDLPNPYGMTNGPTQMEINLANLVNGQGMFDFGNPQPSDSAPPGVETPINFDVSQSIQDLQNFMQTSGIYGLVEQWANTQGYVPIDWSDPNLLFSPAASAAAEVATNAFDPSQFAADFAQLFGTGVSTDFAQMLASELPQLLGTELSEDVLSLF